MANSDSVQRGCRQLVWPAAGLAIGATIAANPFHGERIPLAIGIASWFGAMSLVLLLSGHTIGARIGALAAGALAAVPCFVDASPLPRFLLMCFAAVPLVASAAFVMVRPVAGLPARLGYLCGWCGTRRVIRHFPNLDAAAFGRLAVATVVLAVALVAIQVASTGGPGLLVRWLAAGVGALAFAEMITACLSFVTAACGVTVPPLFRSPYRSRSVGEFWARRWNVGASELFRNYCFMPLARRRIAFALAATFGLSGVAHALLAYMALGAWEIALACGVFFLVQPIIVGAERWLKVRRWRPAAGRIWTLAVLAIVSPLFLEPVLRIIEVSSSGRSVEVLFPAGAALSFVMTICGIISLASLATAPDGRVSLNLRQTSIESTAES